MKNRIKAIAVLFIVTLSVMIMGIGASAENTKEVSMCIDSSRTFSIKGNKDIKWTSSKPENASVDKKGRVTANKKGKTVITAKSGDKVVFKYYITVTDHSEIVEATCTSSAKCGVCKKKIAEPLGHEYSETTCSEQGVCIRCGKESKEKSGHKYIHTSVKATKESKGYDEYTCERCGDSYTENECWYSPKESQVYEDMIALKEEYPAGMGWTNANSYVTKQKGDRVMLGYGCAAFAYILSDEAFGINPFRKHNNKNDIRVGDILRINGDTHSIVVLKINRETGAIVAAEGNLNKSIYWETRYNLKDLRIDYIYTRYPKE